MARHRGREAGSNAGELGAAVGPGAGAILIELAPWRAAFLVNPPFGALILAFLCLCVIGLLTAILCLPLPRRSGRATALPVAGR